MAEMKVQIGVDTQNLDKGLDKAAKSVNKFGKATGGLQKGLKANAVPAMTSFSQVVQDAPFGIRGVANNITQLTMQFGQLSGKTGGAKAALKGMLATLAGPAGILLAVSLVTSLMVSFGDQLNATGKATSELTEATKGFIGTVVKNKSVMEALLSVAEDENASKKDRQRALDKLNDKYKDYLPNLTLENIGTKAVKASIDDLTEGYIRQAKIKGLQSRISELAAKRYEIENKSIAEQTSALKLIGIAVLNLGNVSKASASAAKSGLATQKKGISDVTIEIDKLDSAIGKLIGDDISKGGIFTKVMGDVKSNSVQQKVEQIKPLLATGIASIKEFINQPSNIISLIPPSVSGASVEADIIAAKADAIITQLREFDMAASAIIHGGITDTFAGIGASIGSALVNGENVMAAVGAGLLTTIGDISIQLGQQAIGIGIAMKAIKNAFSNPFTAIAAGIALVALGSYIKGTVSKTTLGSSSDAGGGGNTSFSSGVSGGSTTSRGYQSSTGGGGGLQSSGGTVVFEIAGQKLIGVLSNTLSRNRNLGGSLSVTSG